MLKRLFDIFFSLVFLAISSPLLIISWIILVMDTQSSGLFFQKRVGQFGVLFTIYKLQTINPKTNKISKVGRFIRKYKFDEIPQFLNVLNNKMSIVGPRPDIEGYYDLLEGENRKILQLKPGITSEASIKYKNEDEILGLQEHPLEFNDSVIFPHKVKMNLEYFYHRSFFKDLQIVLRTIIGVTETKKIG